MNDIVTLLSSLDPALLGTILAVALSGMVVLIGLVDGIQMHQKRIREMEARHDAERRALLEYHQAAAEAIAQVAERKGKRKNDSYYLERTTMFDSLAYWWKAGPGPYVARVLKGLLIGVGIVIVIGGTFALMARLFDASLALAEAVAIRIGGDTVAVWFGGLAALIIIGGAVYWQIASHPVERRKKRQDDAADAYDLYRRAQTPDGSASRNQKERY